MLVEEVKEIQEDLEEHRVQELAEEEQEVQYQKTAKCSDQNGNYIRLLISGTCLRLANLS